MTDRIIAEHEAELVVFRAKWRARRDTATLVAMVAALVLVLAMFAGAVDAWLWSL